MKLAELLQARRDEIRAQIKDLRLELQHAEKMLLQLREEAGVAAPAPRKRSESNGTIKDMALEVVRKSSDGLETQGVIEAIQQTFGQSIERTSLSPQLSRLKKEGLIDQVDQRWKARRSTPSDELAALLGATGRDS